MFPKIVVPQNGWFIRENPIKMDDLVVPLFLEAPKYGETQNPVPCCHCDLQVFVPLNQALGIHLAMSNP